MYTIDLAGDTFRDKVMGCWLGKNCGGTLGTPVETAWGQQEMYDLWWYPELRSGGLPNDDLEMQLVWLQALRAKGPGLEAADLAQAWLDHIGYNFDEYGLNKTNLRLGLQPPVSGAWNNWFVDCMGCPIRSEVWACVAPGSPRVAARYAYEDAICDHAGGESVFGELFNVAIQSAAFVLDDPQLLLDIGLSYVPRGSATRKAAEAARQSHADGLDWRQARAAVLAATPSPIAQYSPINLGFQVIGWLYGTDFGDALCKTVNCGYDTDSSGGSIGSWLGIRAGLSQLPEKWVEPFGLGLSTNESWGGVRHLSDGTRPIPTDVVELTTQVIETAPVILRHHRADLVGTTLTVTEADLFADESIHALWARSAWQLRQANRGVEVTVDYLGSAAARPGEVKELGVRLRNQHPDTVQVDLGVAVPVGWAPIEDRRLEIAADSAIELTLGLPIPGRDRVGQRNAVRVSADVVGHPLAPSMPIALPGAQVWRVHEPASGDTVEPDRLPARDVPDPASWRELTVEANALPLAELLAASECVVLQHFLEASQAREVRLGVDCSVATQVWLNGDRVIDVDGPRLIRPSYGVGEHVNPVVRLDVGFNELLVAVRRSAGGDVVQGHTFLSTPDRLRHGVVDVGRTRLPWD
jgi:ADP-ribosylglycohydrolase